MRSSPDRWHSPSSPSFPSARVLAHRFAIAVGDLPYELCSSAHSFLCPPFRRCIDGICWALKDDYARIHDAHKLDPVG